MKYDHCNYGISHPGFRIIIAKGTYCRNCGSFVLHDEGSAYIVEKLWIWISIIVSLIIFVGLWLGGVT